MIARTVDVTLEGDGHVVSRGTQVVLTADSRAATNTINDPRNVVPVKVPIKGLGSKFTVHLDPLSVNVIVVNDHK